MQEERVSAEYLIGYRSIFLMKGDAKREHTRDGHEAQYPFPERTGWWDSNTAVCDRCLNWETGEVPNVWKKSNTSFVFRRQERKLETIC